MNRIPVTDIARANVGNYNTLNTFLQLEKLREDLTQLNIKINSTDENVDEEDSLEENCKCNTYHLFPDYRETHFRVTQFACLTKNSRLTLSGVQVFLWTPTRMTETSQMVSGKTQTIEVNEYDTVEELKLLVEEMEGIPMYKQRLIYDGKGLEDGRFLADYDMQPESTIYAALKPRCGPGDPGSPAPGTAAEDGTDELKRIARKKRLLERKRRKKQQELELLEKRLAEFE